MGDQHHRDQARGPCRAVTRTSRWSTSAPPECSTASSRARTTSSTRPIRSTSTDGPSSRASASCRASVIATSSSAPVGWSEAVRRITSSWPRSSIRSARVAGSCTRWATSWGRPHTFPTSPGASTASSTPAPTACTTWPAKAKEAATTSPRRSCQILGLEDQIELLEVTSDFFADDYPSIRPRSEIMRNLALELQGMNIMRPWRVALEEYLLLNFAQLADPRRCRTRDRPPLVRAFRSRRHFGPDRRPNRKQ